MNWINSHFKFSVLTRILAVVFIFVSSFNYAADTVNGRSLYEKTCAGCHGKNLTGGAGFNLKDEEWVHGSSSSEILENVKKGFAKAGMPPFASMYTEQQLKDIVGYVLSRKEGLRNLTYKIYHIEEDAPDNFDNIDKLVVKKSGKLRNNLMDFTLPEVKNYILEFEGDLFTSPDAGANLFGMAYKEPMQMLIDGVVVQSLSRDWMKNAWPLKSGQHKFTFRFSTAGTNPKRNRDFKLFVSNEKLTQKLFGLSTSGKNFVNNATVNVKAESDIKVVRKKTVNLPVRSISVGYPEKINYAFSTKNCSIVGLWSGDMLNVGPNVEGRGRDGSVILGEWGFHMPESISHDDEATCKFIKYNRKVNPEFSYQLGKQVYAVKAAAVSNKKLEITYRLVSGNNTKTVFNLPNNRKLTFFSRDGHIAGDQLVMNMKQGHKYQLTVSLAE